MNWRVKMAAVVGVALAFTLSSDSAEAQRIRTYSDSPTSASTVTNSNTAQPAPVQGTSTSSNESESSGATPAPAGTHQIGIYGANNARSSKAMQSEVFLKDPEELYQGIIPGVRDVIPHLERSRELSRGGGGATPLTWVGFQAEEARTRVFFQSPRPLSYQVRKAQDGRDLIVVFENARIPERNFSRFIDASFFERAVSRIEATEKRGGVVEVRLTMIDQVEPRVSVEGEYLYLDFAHHVKSAD